jgi:hypothetical protein
VVRSSFGGWLSNSSASNSLAAKMVLIASPGAKSVSRRRRLASFDASLKYVELGEFAQLPDRAEG